MNVPTRGPGDVNVRSLHHDQGCLHDPISHTGQWRALAADDMPSALTAAALVFGDGATQVFTADGRTTYVEQGRTTIGEWCRNCGDRKLASFWPPDYRATYTLRWIVEGSSPTGISFTEDGRGQRFDGPLPTRVWRRGLGAGGVG